MSKHYMDLSASEKKRIITSETPVMMNGISYLHRPLGEDLVEIYAEKDGERLSSSVGVFPSRLDKQADKETLDKKSINKKAPEKNTHILQVRVTKTTVDKVNAKATQQGMSVPDFLRSLLEGL